MIKKKRVFAFIAASLVSVSLLACAAPAEDNGPGPEEVKKKDFSALAGIVHDSKTWYDEFMALPIANENMTEDELRQLCADTFKANMTFPWTPSEPIAYTYELLDKYHDVSLPYGIAYSGLFYATGIDYATCGNIWKVLPFYDHETGVVDIEAMGTDVQMLNNMTSACSYGAIQAWNRVSNSHRLSGMNSYNQFDAGIVPVGDYKYEENTYNFNFGSRTASNEVIAANDLSVMYESLALMKVADGLYSSSSWHVMMCSQAPVVVRFPDGTINPIESYMYVHEQGAVGTKGDSLNYLQPNGVTMRPLGTIDNKYTFDKLISSGYIPFTIKEFIGEDPVEAGKAWIGTETEPMENGLDLTVDELFSKNLFANYNLCNFRVEVKAPDGTVLVSYSPITMTKPTPKFYTFNLWGMQNTERMAPYANGKNTVHIYARLANGELIEAYKTILKMG